jgi:hypothetical protein
MITLTDLAGPWSRHPDWTPARAENGARLLAACSALEAEMIAGGVAFPVNKKTGSQVSGSLYGGFRPQSCPQGSPKSAHKEGFAVDRYDPLGHIDAWLMAHQDAMDRHGIYIEHPDDTPGWSHWSIRAPKSGKHVFKP